MNTKKSKNKNRPNKPPNPNPPQKVEDVTPVDTGVQQHPEIKESVPKVEERVPELSSEVIPVLINEEKTDETPKKPKRNRGKKKSQDLEDKEEIPAESQETKVQTEQLQLEEVSDVPEVAPSARKKKNKGKKSSEVTNIISEKKEEKAIVVEEPTTTGVVKVEAKEEIFPIGESSLEQDTKSSKKKNKKKKHRSDSEKSEKTDELSCVTAFQKLLKDEKSEVKEEITCKPIGEGDKGTIEKIKSDIIEVAVREKEDVVPELRNEDVFEMSKQSVTESNKGKKENKKEKKNPHTEEPKEMSFDSVPVLLEVKSTFESVSTLSDLSSSAVKEENLSKEFVLVESKTSDEDILKSKAKIAKPVERKKKKKAEDQKDFVSDKTPQDVLTPLVEYFTETKEKGQYVFTQKEVKESQGTAGDISQTSTSPTEAVVETMPSADILSTTDAEKGKKRKKSPKPKKHHSKAETDETPVQTRTTFNVVAETIICESEVKPQEKSTMHLTEIGTKIEIKSDALPTPDIEKGNKRKKSPKPKKHHLIAETEETPLQPSTTVNVVAESIISELEVKPKDTATMHLTEIESMTEIKNEALPTPNIEKGNKRKKSPKPKKHQESSETDQSQYQTSILKDVIDTENKKIEIEEEKLSDIIDTIPPLLEITTAIITSATESGILPERDIETDKKSKKSSKQKKGHQVIEKEVIQDLKGISVDVEEKISIETEVKPEERKSEEIKATVSKADEEVGNKTPESKTKKKPKKSPMLPMETTTEIMVPVCSQKDLNKRSFKTSDLLVEDKIESSCNFPSQDDIEISSLKAEESEGSTCGVTPDLIQYPRATSQELIDDNNNNMIIQEITVIEETRLEIPVQIPHTPLICGSGETPLVTPEIEVPSSSLKLDQPKESEKTDIKSKMMEVNQDMEELRLSIEKSLAELTSMEKNEEELETEFANKMLIITEESLSMPSDIVAKAEIANIVAATSKDSVTSKKNTSPISETSGKCTTENQNKDMKIKTENTPLLASESTSLDNESTEIFTESIPPPICPARKDNKNKGKSKKKGKQDISLPTASTESTPTTAISESTKQEKTANRVEKTDQKTEQKIERTKEKSKQQSEPTTEDKDKTKLEQESHQETTEFEPIENFEDAMTSSADDINKSFEMIANDSSQVEASHVNPEINIIAPIEDTKQEKRDEKVNPLSQPKNLLGHPDIPVPSNKIDYKKEKNKSPNESLAKVKIKDSIEVEAKRQSKESQTDNIRKFMKNKSIDESFSLMNENNDFVYKYSFRRVFLQSSCHVCKKELKQSRVPCSYCCLVFYCSGKHKDEDWTQHQALCFAVSTISHLKDQKHIYADAKNVTGQDYRLLRMQMIVSCEKVLKRRLVPWEQEALLYPRICADVSCREWRQSKLVDCEGCCQISYCAEHPDHFPKSHQRWCKSYSLYQKLVSYQQTKGRLEPKLPSKVIMDYHMPEKMNEVLASMYEEKIDMSDIQYATLTQIATAPLTAAYCYQMARKHQPHANGTCKKTTCTIHVVDAELQFEADALNKWEVFFLHLTPVDELRVVMISAHLNPGNLPLELLSKIKLCEDCRLKNRRVIFNFHDKQTYYEYWAGEDYIAPNLVCAFNANINRSSLYNTKDPWPKTINCILKQKVPFLITDHTLNEIHKDFVRIKETAEHKYAVIVDPKINYFASVRPDRNFISDDEMPLLFKNYCFALFLGVN